MLQNLTKEEINKSGLKEREYDIIVYGASSFTAKYVIKQLKECDLKIALCARTISKIPKTHFDTFSADLTNIKHITKRTKVLINLAGPYIHTGIDIINACVETNTDYVDITGEVNFMKESQKEYATTSNVSIVHSCGFDSIPSDLGAFHLAKHFDECEIICDIAEVKTHVHTGTWLSFLESLKAYKKRTNNKLHQTNKKNQNNKQKDENVIVRDGAHFVKYFGPDAFVVNSSAAFLKNICKYDYKMYLKVKSKLKLYIMMFFIFILSKLINYKLFNYLFKTFPRIFSGGFVKTNITDKEIEGNYFNMEMVARGSRDGKEKTKKLKITGKDPSYTSTAIFVTECAFQFITNRSKIPKGVHTPASAFYNTNILDCIQRKGIEFKMCE